MNPKIAHHRLVFVLVLFVSSWAYGQTDSSRVSLNDEIAQKISKGVTTKADITKLFGTPDTKSLTADIENWTYYDNSRTLSLFFDKKGLVTSYNYKSSGASNDIAIVNRSNFIELIEKVQNDKSLRGSFMYKGSKVNIFEDTDYKTAIGKFLKIEWNGLTAIYHTALGYMTRTRFNMMKQSLHYEGKVEDHKYCKDNYCFELRTDKKYPYIISYKQADSEIREIK